MNIGILGGSFNPVHNGHLRLAVEALEQLGLDRVELVPAGIPPHKASEDLLPFADRCRLLELAAKAHPGLRVNPLEGERNGPSYTLDTLTIFRERFPGAELYFILGAGDFLDLPSWYRWEELFDLAHFAVVGREEEGVEDLTAFMARLVPGEPVRMDQTLVWDHPRGRTVRYFATPRLDISSTMLRSRLDQGRSLAFLVPVTLEAELRRLWQIRMK